MKTISNQITGNITVSENTTFHNVDVDSVIINEGITARLYGSINKEITVKKNGIAYIHGKVPGKVTNLGGTVSLFKENGKVVSYGPSVKGS